MTAFRDTRSSGGYRKLHFQSLEECSAEVQRILERAKLGQLRTTGNWSGGQILSHLAAWIEYGYAGYPLKPPPLPIRWILRLGLKKMLSKGMSRGVRIPGVKDGTVGAEESDIQAAGQRFLVALARLQSGEESPYDSPGFGKMSHEDRIRLNLRHAELHLGFFGEE